MTIPGESNFDELERAGFPVWSCSEQEQAVLAALTRAELDLILDLKARLDAAEPEVQGHGPVAGGALF